MSWEELSENLQIKNERLLLSLSAIKISVKDLWDIKLHHHYTRHGPDHSERVIKKCELLLKNSSILLNQSERLIFLASAYLHDIGMQSPIDAGLPKKSRYSDEELELIRKRHNISSARMIRRSIAQNSDISLGLEKCKEYVDCIATVSEYHRELNLQQLKETSIGDDFINLQLLAALLKLCDELDCDFNRVKMEILKIKEIPIESKFHWWAHHYTKSINFQNGLFLLFFRFPENSRKEENIINAFKNKMVESIRNHILEVYEILKMNGLEIHDDILEIREVEYTNTVEQIPKDLRDYIINFILKIGEDSETFSRVKESLWHADGVPYSDNIDILKHLVQVYQLVSTGENKKALNEIEGILLSSMNPIEKMYFLLFAGNCALSTGELSEAKVYYKTALQMTEEGSILVLNRKKVILLKIMLYGNMGQIHQFRGDLEESLTLFNKMKEYAENSGNKKYIAIALGNIGEMQSRKLEFELALENSKRALEINREIENKMGEAAELSRIGRIYNLKNEEDLAEKSYLDSLQIYQKLENSTGVASVLNNLGFFYLKHERINVALEYLVESLIIHKENDDLEGQALNYNYIGLVYFSKRKYKLAMDYFELAKDFFKLLENKSGEAITLLNIGGIFLAKRKWKSARKVVREGSEILKKSELSYILNSHDDALKKYEVLIKYQKKKWLLYFIGLCASCATFLTSFLTDFYYISVCYIAYVILTLYLDKSFSKKINDEIMMLDLTSSTSI